MNINFMTSEINADPYPALQAVRETGRAVFNEINGEWMITGHDDVMAVLHQHRQATLEAQREDATRMFGGEMLEVKEGPHHHELRNVWAKDFSVSEVAKLSPYVTQIIDDAFDAVERNVAAGEGIEAVSQLTRSIPARIIAHLLGITPEMRPNVIRWSDDMADSLSAMLDSSERGDALREASRIGTAKLREHLGELVAHRRAHPGNDPISKMVHSAIGKRIEDDELLANCVFLTFAGNETTAKLLATTLVVLARYPDQRRILAEHRSLIPGAVNEILRYAAVAQAVPRMVVGAPIEAAGRRFEPGDKFMLFFGAANRDPARWENPGRFDVTRKPLRNLGFGFGPHLCLGLNLARLEAIIFIERLLDRMPSYDVGQVDFGANFMLRGPQQIELRRC